MRGTIIKKNRPNAWSLVFDEGFVTDPATGTRKRKQRWVSFTGTKGEADAKLVEMVRAVGRNEFVVPAKTTVIEHMRTWLVKTCQPPRIRPSTFRQYRSIIERHIATSALANVPIQKVTASDLEAYYAAKLGTKEPGAVRIKTLKSSSLAVHHAILSKALRTAVRDRVLTTNPAPLVEHCHKGSKAEQATAVLTCWSAAEAQVFLDYAGAHASLQTSAFLALAVDSGARSAELAGLKWSDLNDTGDITIARQLYKHKGGGEPEFGPTKTGTIRTVRLNTETLDRLRKHKIAQAELRMKNAATYRNFGLIFAKEWEHIRSRSGSRPKLGEGLKVLSERPFYRLAKDAGIRRVKFHALRHTSATLLLQAGVPVHIVSARLGHSKASMTLDVYSHALPGDQADAAARLGAVLSGKGAR